MSNNSNNTPPLYFWHGKILNDAGRLVDKFCIGNFSSVAFQYAIHYPFPSNQPTIKKITGTENLSVEEEEQLEKIMKDCEDI